MVYNLDSELHNADWLKTQSWDLPTEPAAFLHVIGGRENLGHFMQLPAARAMPAELRLALNADVKGKKYREDQLRVPAGVPEGGRFASETGGGPSGLTGGSTATQVGTRVALPAAGPVGQLSTALSKQYRTRYASEYVGQYPVLRGWMLSDGRTVEIPNEDHYAALERVVARNPELTSLLRSGFALEDVAMPLLKEEGLVRLLYAKHRFESGSSVNLEFWRELSPQQRSEITSIVRQLEAPVRIFYDDRSSGRSGMAQSSHEFFRKLAGQDKRVVVRERKYQEEFNRYVLKVNPNVDLQPRDDHGRWTDSSMGTATAEVSEPSGGPVASGHEQAVVSPSEARETHAKGLKMLNDVGFRVVAAKDVSPSMSSSLAEHNFNEELLAKTDLARVEGMAAGLQTLKDSGYDGIASLAPQFGMLIGSYDKEAADGTSSVTMTTVTGPTSRYFLYNRAFDPHFEQKVSLADMSYCGRRSQAVLAETGSEEKAVKEAMRISTIHEFAHAIDGVFGGALTLSFMSAIQNNVPSYANADQDSFVDWLRKNISSYGVGAGPEEAAAEAFARVIETDYPKELLEFSGHIHWFNDFLREAERGRIPTGPIQLFGPLPKLKPPKR